MWNYGWDGYNFRGYGGMIGHAKLLTRQAAWIEDSVHVECADAGGGAWRCAVGLAVVGSVSSTDHVSLAVCQWGASGTPCIRATQPCGINSSSRMTLTATVPEAQLWAPGTRAARANLYLANLTLWLDGEPGATRSTRFGIRSLDTNGPRILFNGEPLFLAGYGDDAQYAFTGAPPMDKDYYMAQLTGMKDLGYNFIRFVRSCPACSSKSPLG